MYYFANYSVVLFDYYGIYKLQRKFQRLFQTTNTWKFLKFPEISLIFLMKILTNIGSLHWCQILLGT